MPDAESALLRPGKKMYIAELNDLDEVTQLEIEGFRMGMYLRLGIHYLPFEMVK